MKIAAAIAALVVVGALEARESAQQIADATGPLRPSPSGIGLTALVASFMSGMAGNVTAFNTVWTYDIYQAHIRKGASDAHYLWMGRAATVAGIVLAATIALNFLFW